MKCRDARELINAYIDNGIDPLKDSLLAGHIEHCDRCRKEMEFLESWNKSIKGIKPVKAPGGFMLELRRRLEVERRHPLKRYIDLLNSFRNSIRFPVEAAALVVIGSVVFALYRPDRFMLPKVAVPVTESSEVFKGEKFTGDGIQRKTAPGQSNVTADRIVETKSKESPAEKKFAEPEGGDKVSDDISGADSREAEENLSGDVIKSEELTVHDEQEKRAYDTDNSLDAEKDSYRSNSRITGKARADAAVKVTPEDIFKKYNVKILKVEDAGEGITIYTVSGENGRNRVMLDELNARFKVKVRSATGNGTIMKNVIILEKDE